MDFILHGYCSLYCGVCPIMLNTKARTGIGKISAEEAMRLLHGEE